MSDKEILTAIRQCSNRDVLAQVIGTALSRFLAFWAPEVKAETADEWLTVREASGIFKISVSYLYHATRRKDAPLPSRKIGKKLLFSRREIEQFLEQSEGYR